MSTEEMSQVVQKLEKDREEHQQSIKRLSLAELRQKVSHLTGFNSRAESQVLRA